MKSGLHAPPLGIVLCVVPLDGVAMNAHVSVEASPRTR